MFELRSTSGGWSYVVLYRFQGAPDGVSPQASLVFDGEGRLYGTTLQGGANGQGTVFMLTPSPGGGWTEEVLYSFGAFPSDGDQPLAGLVLDASGSLYGTTSIGGTYGLGTVFELSPVVGGGWVEAILYSFGGSDDGAQPRAPVVFDNAGNLYGTTLGGGPAGGGTIFELAPNSGGGWTESILHTFLGGNDGFGPSAGLVFDAAGNLFGTTVEGGGVCGNIGCGIVFELSPTLGNGWAETVIHRFYAHKGDGNGPVAPVVLDGLGNLYGTSREPSGAVFRLTQKPNGDWVETGFHAFSGSDGANPEGGVILDTAGGIYGTTFAGGNLSRCGAGCGVVFEIIP